MKEGQTVYRVGWKGGIPYIEHGKIIVVGKKRNTKKIKWQSCEKSSPLQSGYSSIRKALKEDILDTAGLYGRYDWIGHRNVREDVNTLIYAINKTRRLYEKLKKHHLV